MGAPVRSGGSAMCPGTTAGREARGVAPRRPPAAHDAAAARYPARGLVSRAVLLRGPVVAPRRSD